MVEEGQAQAKEADMLGNLHADNSPDFIPLLKVHLECTLRLLPAASSPRTPHVTSPY